MIDWNWKFHLFTQEKIGHKNKWCYDKFFHPGYLCFSGTIIILWLDIEGLPGQLNQIQSTVFFSSAQHIWASSMAIFSIVHHSTDMLQVLFPAGIPSCPPCEPFWFRWSNLAHKNQNFLHWFVTTWNLIWMHKNVPYFITIFICHWKWRCIYLVHIRS